MKALVGTFNQEKALVGAFSVITNLRMDLRFKLYFSIQTVHSPFSRHILASAIKNLYESEEDVEEAPSNCNRCN